jgi:hypothetical protein
MEEVHYVVRYDGNWGDEFDIYFHTTMDEKQYQRALEEANSWEEDEVREYYFGTNESIYISKEDILEALEYGISKITGEERAILASLNLEEISFGDGLNWDDILHYEIE